MNIEEKKAIVEAYQKFFFLSFIISFVLLLIATVMCIAMQDVQLAFVNKYFPMDLKDYNYLVVLTLGIWKMLIVQFTLIPAIAIWCMRQCCKCGCKKD